jgi:hypothetical protein
MAFEQYIPETGSKERKNSVFVTVKHKTSGKMRLLFSLSSDVVSLFSDADTKRVKVLFDKQDPKKILFLSGKQEEANTLSFAAPKGAKTRRINIPSLGHAPRQDHTSCKFDKFNHNGQKGLLVTLPD